MKFSLLTIVCLGVVCSCASLPQPTQPPILSRSEWHAHAPVAEMKTQKIQYLTIHHTAVRQKPDRSLVDKLQSLQKFSQHPGTLGNGKPKPAWPDVPYHFYIDCHGQIAEGRELKYVGDTNTEYDPTGHALIVLEGNFEEEQPTEAQLAALRQTITWLAARYHVPGDRIAGHQDYAGTLCPGKNLEILMPEFKQLAANH